ncbi:CAP-Gly domain-containing linker protein 1-like [Xenia sp. Carnegie-2017]|uniref:CAP-Gly domain-containing linker protein 1-like n=1 Tax=Xenia sp. Carnegie-2017 TaxID=2897299 RepID=UPI001F048090|nr:CAP-Gly domain-containing linker protein 1-like [Xenia sp. Carnegie-2017]
MSNLPPVLKRSNGPQETPKTEKRSALPSSTNAILTPRTFKQNGSLGKSKLGLVAAKSNFGDGAALRRDSSKEVHSTSLRRELSSSQSSLVKEQIPPVLTREKTQESLKDKATGILFKVGDRVLVAGTKSGVIEYLGGTKFAKGLWAGVKLDEAEGKNDGSVAGVRYFDCQPLHGVFSKPNRLHKINIVSKNYTSDVSTILSESLKIGDEVLVGGSKLGILRYLGPTEFAKGEWAGVELKEPLGKNDGAVAGTRYFTCEMLYGLFAPSSKVTKSKKKVFNAKLSNSPIPSLDVAAKMVFSKTSSIDSDVASETLPHLPSPGEKHIAEDDDLSKSNESHHIGLKKTTSNTQQVVALQSALEEREREIHKMLVEPENGKVNDVTLNGKNSKNSFNEQLLKDKDDIINALKPNLQTAKSENSIIQAKLDEEKKKYEELQFMLEEEKITDDELKDHVKQDETTIKELSSQYEEKNLKITKLQNELREARLDKQANEAKLKELRVELDESRNDFESLKRSVDTTNKDSDHKLEISLENMKKELHESKQLLIKKDHESSELQKMLNDQREYMEKERVNLNDRLSTVENEKTAAKGDVLRMKQGSESLNEELRQYKHTNIEIETNLKIREEKLQTLERKYNELSKENLAAMSEKDENSKITLMNLNARITELEGELIEAKANVSQLENNMALERDIAKQKEKQLDDHLVNAKKQLEESIEDSKIKQQVANDIENKLNIQLNREKEIIKEKEELKELQVLIKECERLKDETVSAKENLQLQYKNLDTKCRELSQKNVELVAERNDVIKLCDEQDKQLDALKTEEGKLTLERDSLL